MNSLGSFSALLPLLLLLHTPTARGQCSTPERIENTVLRDGKLNDSYAVGTNLTYRCLSGYKLISGVTPKITCSNESKWLPENPQFCEGQRCSPPDIENGRIVATGDIRLGDEITFVCNDGYRLIGDKTARCTLKSGSVGWNNQPECQLIPCFPPPQINHGSMFGDVREEYAFGSAVTYRCDKDYSLIGNKTLVCGVAADGENGEWNSPPPVCQVVQCPRPEIDRGRINAHMTSYSYEHSLIVTCEDGYRLSGESFIKCGADNEWHPPVPKCELVPEPTGSATVIAPTTVPSGDETVPGATKSPKDKPASTNTPKDQTATTKTPTDESGPSSNLGTILGCLFGVLLLITAVCAGALYYNRKKGKMDTNTGSPNAYNLVPQKTDPEKTKPSQV